MLCSHVVYAVRKIVPFVDKCDLHARRACFIAIRVSQFDSFVRPLWEQVYGEPRSPEPTFLDLSTLLYDMGIVPNVEIVPFGGRRGVGPAGGFADLDEAAGRCREMLFLDPDPTTDAQIRAYVDGKLWEQNGRLVWAGQAMQSAIVWWTQEPLHRIG